MKRKSQSHKESDSEVNTMVHFLSQVIHAIRFSQDPSLDPMNSIQKQSIIDLRRCKKELEIEITKRTKELMESQSQLKESHLLLDGIIEGSTDPIFLKNMDGKYIIINSATAKVLGKTVSEVLGKTAKEIFEGLSHDLIIPKEIQQLSAEGDAEVFRTGKPQLVECILIYKCKQITFMTLKSPFKDSEGNIIGVINIARDITKYKRVEEERSKFLAKRNAALEASRMKSRFLANMSHEIRTPMNGVIGMAELLLDTPLTTAQQDYVETIKSSANELLNIINEILDFSKVEAGKLTLAAIDFDLNRLISEIEKVVTISAKKKGLTLVIKNNSNTAVYFKGDPGRIRQVLTNLLDNAIKFTNHGEVTLQISIKPKTKTHSQLRFLVTDTGIGIPKKESHKLFKSFSQADSSITQRSSGTGLGLSICKRLVTLMGGKIGVKSHAGKGSRFWFTLDLERTQKPKSQESQKINAESLLSLKNQNIRILVAEDNPTNQKVVLKMLESLGCHASSVSTGHEVLDALKHASFDLLFMDCRMPDMDGYETTKIIRNSAAFSSYRNTPIIALTASAIKGDMERCLAAGMDDYVTKPIDKNALARKILCWLSLRVDSFKATPSDIPIEQPLVQKNEKQSDCHKIASICGDVIDPNAIDRLLDIGTGVDQIKILDEFLESFFKNAPERIEKLRSAVEPASTSSSIDSNNLKSLLNEAHTLKSSCAYAGAQHMKDLCDTLEKLDASQLKTSAPKLIQSLDHEFTKTKQVLMKVSAMLNHSEHSANKKL